MTDLMVTITPDTSAFDAAIRQAIEAIDRFGRWYAPFRLGRQRHRSRLVTRRKQRSRW